jgi:Na+-transporting NADH:ubiquinone oxidoreductase subunit B
MILERASPGNRIEPIPGQRELALALILPLLVRVAEDGIESAAPRLGLLALAFAVSQAWRAAFAGGKVWLRPAAGQFSFALLFALMLPAPVGWGSAILARGSAILAISFGWVFGREIFGGKSILSPTLVALAFAVFSFPQGGFEAHAVFSDEPDLALALACLPGAAWLTWRRFLSWQTLAGALIGVAAASLFAAVPGAPSWWTHVVLGGFPVGVLFLAAAPESAPRIPAARWLHGAVVGAMVVVIRLFNPVQPDGVVFAALIGALFAPLLDRALGWRKRDE